jgi:hypothetical protein
VDNEETESDFLEHQLGVIPILAVFADVGEVLFMLDSVIITDVL